MSKQKENEMIPVNNNSLTNMACEKCGEVWSWYTMFAGIYPAHLCDNCRRDLQLFMMHDVEYKAFCATASPDNGMSNGERFSLYFDLQKELGFKFNAWLKIKNEEKE